MFLNINEQYVNLLNVSNINILLTKRRIVLNMNYNIQINCGKGGRKKFISDYIYWDANSDIEFENNIRTLNKHFIITDNFVMKPNGQGFININEISSVKFIDKTQRVIFNLSHPVTFTDQDGYDKITSEFVYVNIQDKPSYTDYKQYINYELTN